MSGTSNTAAGLSAAGLSEAERAEAIRQQQAARARQMERQREHQARNVDPRDNHWTSNSRNLTANIIHLMRGENSGQNPWPNMDFTPYVNGDKVPPMIDFTFNGAAAYGMSFRQGLSKEETDAFILHPLLDATHDAIRNYACANLFNSPDNQIGFLTEVRQLIQIGMTVRNNLPPMIMKDGDEEDDDDYLTRLAGVLNGNNTAPQVVEPEESEESEESEQPEEVQEKTTKKSKKTKSEPEPESEEESEEESEVEDADDESEDLDALEFENSDDDDDDDDEESVDLTPPRRTKKAFKAKPKGKDMKAKGKKQAGRKFGRR